ncbi:MAG: hypothetical protein N2116_06165 [Armatimonadetes bacterium]|nr:hypothetical protein [Armatimonadota bacterium]
MKCRCGRKEWTKCHRCGAPVCYVHAVFDYDSTEKRVKWMCELCRDIQIRQIPRDSERELKKAISGG